MGTRAPHGLSIRVGTDLATLADDLGRRLAASPLAVLEPELVVVPTPGIRHWLEPLLATTLGAATDDGICANLDVLFFDALLRRATGRPTATDDPWSVDRMTVNALDILANGELPDLLDVQAELGATGVFELARSSADLFDQLFRWRPDVVAQWLGNPRADPRAALLVALESRIAEPPPHAWIADALARLADGDDAGVDLPARLHVFGGDSLPGGPLLPRLLDALGTVRDVTMHVVVASAARFTAVLADTPRFSDPVPERTSDDARGIHPLLRSWGAAGRETAMLLAQLPDRPTTTFVDVSPSPPPEPSLLTALSSSIRDGGAGATGVAADRSIELHGCVGERRQVEVIRDAILHALNEDPTLQPSDVVVLCPRLSRFAPLIDAILGDPQGAPSLPYLLSDRSLSRTVPLITSMNAVMSLLGGRFARSDVLDVLRDPFVRARFHLEEDDVDRFTRWADVCDVRWGLDGVHRTSAGLPAAFEAGTWRRLRDRLLVGVALPAGSAPETLGVRAVDPGYDLECLGSLCAALEALSSLHASSKDSRAVPDWCDFTLGLGSMLFDVGYDGAGQLEVVVRILADLTHEARELSTPIAFREFRSLLADRTQGAVTSTPSGPGGVTVTSLAPLRNVPFAVVAVLGLDDGSLQQQASTDPAFGAPRVGDRDARAEVRAALLGAVLSARRRLIVTSDAADLTTNDPVPSSTALAELRDAIDLVCADGVGAITYEHPRHAHGSAELAFDARLAAPFSYDGDALARARALHCAAPGAATLPAAPLAAERTVSADGLAAFLKAPQRLYLRETLGVVVPRADEPPQDELPTALDALALWQLTTDLVAQGDRAMAAGPIDDEAWSTYLESWASAPDTALSSLPGRLSDDALVGESGAGPRALDLLRHLRGKTKGLAGESIECEATLPSGLVVTADPRVYGGDTTVKVTASGDEGRARLESTIDLLVLTAFAPDVPWRAVRIWRKGKSASSKVATVPSGDPAERAAMALGALDALCGLRARGLVAPIPLFFRVSMKLLAELEGNDDPTPEQLIVAGLGGWEVFMSVGDKDDPSVRFCFEQSYEALSALPCEPGDPNPHHDTGGSRMLAYSLTLCETLLSLGAAERAGVP